MSPYSELERLAMLLSGIMVMVFFVTPRESKYYYAFALLYSVGLLRLWDKFYFYNEVKRYIKTGDAVIDIGANLGYYTYIFSGLVGKEGTVYAIEPIKDFHNLLVIRLEISYRNFSCSVPSCNLILIQVFIA